MVTETSGTRTGTLDYEYENIGIIPIYFVFHCPLGPKYIRVVGQAIIYIQNISTNNQESDRKKIPPHKKFLIMLCSV